MSKKWQPNIRGGNSVFWQPEGQFSKKIPLIPLEPVLFTGSRDDEASLRDPEDGSVTWSYTDPMDTVRAIATDPEGFVYMGDNNAIVHKVTSDGTNVWTYEMTNSGVRSIAVDADGFVYAGNNWELTKLNSDGVEQWERTYQETVLALDVDDTFVYSGDSDGVITSLQKNNTVEWTYSTGQAFVQGIAVDPDGFVYACTRLSSGVLKLDSKGDEVWSRALSASPNDLSIDQQGDIYITSNDGKTSKLDGTDGSLIWEFESPTTIDGMGVAADPNGYTYFTKAGQTTNVTKLDASNIVMNDSDRLIWTLDAGNAQECVATEPGTYGAFPTEWEFQAEFARVLETGILEGSFTSSGDLVGSLTGADIEIAGVVTSTSDGSGSYIVDPIAESVYEVTAIRTDYETSVASNVEILADATTTQDFTLSPLDGSIAGTVESSGSLITGIEGVNVSSSGLDNDVSDIPGNFLLQNASGDTDHSVTFSSADYNDANQNVEVLANKDVTGVLQVLTPLDGSIQGSVVDDLDAHPLGSGIEVTTNALSDTTDTNSEFSFINLDGDETYLLEANTDGYEAGDASVDVGANEDVTGADVRLIEELKYWIYFSASGARLKAVSQRSLETDVPIDFGADAQTFMTTDPNNSVYVSMDGSPELLRFTHDGAGNWGTSDWNSGITQHGDNQVIRDIEISDTYLFVLYDVIENEAITGNYVEIFDPETGASLDDQVLQFSEPSTSLSVVGSDLAYVAVDGDKIFEYTVDTSTNTLSVGGEPVSTESVVINNMVADQGSIYIGLENGSLIERDRTDGSEIAATQISTNPVLDVSIDGSYIYLITKNNKVGKYEKGTHTQSFLQIIDPEFPSNLKKIEKGNDDKIYIGTQDNMTGLRDLGSDFIWSWTSSQTSDGNDLAVEPGTYGAFPLSWD